MPDDQPFTLPSMPIIDPAQLTNPKVSLLLKGDSGTGKTHTALGFPGPIYTAYADVNRATLRNFMRADATIGGASVPSWDPFAKEFVPAVINRTIPAATLIIDTIDMIAEMLIAKIKGTRAGLEIRDWGTVHDSLADVTKSLASATAPRGDHPGYNVVFTAHLRDVTDDKGALLRRVPGFSGGFANKIEAYFDYVFLCTAREVSKEVNRKAVRSKEFTLHTVSPDRYNSCKGGALPPQITVAENDCAFDMLNEYWKL